MYLESITIKNFRKFKDSSTVYFVGSKAITNQSTDSLIAPSSTLIIGKNNTGKTTIAHALNLIINKNVPKAHDFNMEYIKEVISGFEQDLSSGSKSNENMPYLEFRLLIKLDIETQENTEGDFLNNLYQFISISEEELRKVEIIVKYQIKEEENFRNEIYKILQEQSSETEPKIVKHKKFEKICDFLNKDTCYKKSYFTSSDIEVEKPHIKDLIQIKEIKANRHLKEGVLSDIYQEIVSSEYTNNEDNKNSLKETIQNINAEIDRAINTKSEALATILQVIEDSKHVGMQLNGNVSQESILSSLIKYSFIDGEDFIPEDQFGLGYINLLNIIGEIIHYIDEYEESSYQNRVNILFIEEPEAFMHPQMQEFFITKIDNAVKKVLELAGQQNNKVLHCQIVITTHSSHIVNSKIHSCNSFDNINYLTTVNKSAKAIMLNDQIVCGRDDKESNENLKFIKKHIKYKVSELFFADAVIFVEGITEETLFKFYLDRDPILQKYYIAIFNINGAYGKLYHPLVQVLKIPCLIVTDLDIKRMSCEKNEKHEKKEKCDDCNKKEDSEEYEKSYKQITSLKDRTTTNDTLKHFDDEYKKKSTTDKLELENIDYFTFDNLHVIFQKDAIESQFATSFEEAFILTNYNNDILNSALKKCKPKIYEGVVNVNKQVNYKNLIEKSYELQKKLSDKKSEFANGLLFEMIISEGDIPQLPKYINDGFGFLEKKLQPINNKMGAV